jgi:hypothetical protein|tara:strand:+ start:84 stop:521 length:438 start_codon:yes stop_codon:yes gene_type:complete
MVVDMLIELMAANAAFAVIKQTLSNGKEIAEAGSALTKYFSASQAIEKKAKLGTGDVLAAYQAKQAIERQEKELEFMLNKQGLLGYYKYQQFRDEFHKKQKDASKKQKVRQAKINSNINDGLIAMGIVIIILAAAFGVAFYLRTY